MTPLQRALFVGLIAAGLAGALHVLSVGPVRLLAAVISGIWRARTDRYSEVRGLSTRRPPAADGRVEMSYIGG